MGGSYQLQLGSQNREESGETALVLRRTRCPQMKRLVC